jgi:hypothetical protein
MKKIFFGLIFLMACRVEHKPLQYDDQGIRIVDSVTLKPHDRYYQSVDKPTRGVSALVDIRNNGDTAKTFIVKIIEK